MTVAAIRYGKILNRGFLNGPLSIQYGIIMIIVLLDINDLWDYPLYQFITCMVIVFMTEYASGAILKRITGRRFWDYSDMKLNVGGYTCAFSVLGWGFTAAVTVWLINPLVCIVYSLIPVNVVKVLEIIAIVVFLIDLFVTAATMLNGIMQAEYMVMWLTRSKRQRARSEEKHMKLFQGVCIKHFLSL